MNSECIILRMIFLKLATHSLFGRVARNLERKQQPLKNITFEMLGYIADRKYNTYFKKANRVHITIVPYREISQK